MRNEAGILAWVLLSACAADDGHVDSGEPTFFGEWRMLDYSSVDCTGQVLKPAPGDPEYVIFLRPSLVGLELVEPDQDDLATELWVYRYTIAGNRASLDGAQTCTTTVTVIDETTNEPYETESTTTWTRDELMLNGDLMYEDGTSLDEQACEWHLKATWERR